MCIRDRLSAATQLNGTFAASAWLIIFTASAGFVAKAIPFGTWVAVIRIGSSVQALGQIQCPVDEGMALARHISAEHADLAICDLARRPRILTSDSAGCLLYTSPSP